jgi:hypothetical protein
MGRASSSCATVAAATLVFAVLSGCVPAGQGSGSSETAAGSDLDGWDVAAMRATAQRHAGGFCRLQPWPQGMPQPQSVAGPAVTISGADLASYEANVDPAITRLNYLNAEALATGRTEALEAFFMDMVDRQLFTRLAPYRPETWHGTRPDWLAGYNTVAEPAYYAAILLIPASIAYAILAPGLDPARRERAEAWGHTVFRASNEAADGLSGAAAADRRAAKAAGYVAWGAAADDTAAFARGAELFRTDVDAIRRDGSESYYVDDNAEIGNRALLYENNIYAFLVIAAQLLERNGAAGYAYRGDAGGTIEAGVEHLLGTTFDPTRRTMMSPDQDTRYATATFAWTNNSLAYLEYLARDGRMAGDRPLLERGRAARGDQGFYAGNLGGYTSCLFSPD